VNSQIVKNVIIFLGLIALGFATRMVPYVTSFQSWNLNAVMAIALFAGFYFRSPIVALAAAAFPMLLGDLAIVRYHSLEMVANYVGLLLPVFIGPILRQRLSVTSVGTSTIGASLIFFFVSNTAFWWANKAHTSAELLLAYSAGIPFFRGTLAGNVVFSAMLFGTYAIALQRGWLTEEQQAATATSV
jgi:hypothetical protein